MICLFLLSVTLAFRVGTSPNEWQSPQLWWTERGTKMQPCLTPETISKNSAWPYTGGLHTATGTTVQHLKDTHVSVTNNTVSQYFPQRWSVNTSSLLVSKHWRPLWPPSLYELIQVWLCDSIPFHESNITEQHYQFGTQTLAVIHCNAQVNKPAYKKWLFLSIPIEATAEKSLTCSVYSKTTLRCRVSQLTSYKQIML